MCTEHQGGTGRHIVQIFDEDGAALFEVFHHIRVVHNFMTHIHRCAKLLQSVLHDVDGTVNARAKTSRFGQDNFFKRGLCHSDSQNANDLHFESDRLIGQGVVEVKQHRVV